MERRVSPGPGEPPGELSLLQHRPGQSLYLERQRLAGHGQDGANGQDGVSVVWKGALAQAPANPQVNWAYYNTAQGKAFIWNGSVWQILAQDGADGQDGVSIIWKGSLAQAPANPQVNWAYYSTAQGKAFIWDGDAWQILALDGTDGRDGVSVVWKGELAQAPDGPQVNWAYYSTAQGKAFIWNGEAWQILAQDGAGGSGGEEEGGDDEEAWTVWQGPLQAGVYPPPGGPYVVGSRQVSVSGQPRNRYVVYAGSIADMYFTTLASVNYNGLPIDYSLTYTHSTSVTNSLTVAVSNSFTLSEESSETLGEEVTVEAGVEIKVFSASVSAKVSFEQTDKNMMSRTDGKSTENTSSTSDTFAQSQTRNYHFGVNDRPAGRYRTAVYGTSDVWVVLETSLDNRIIKDWDTIVCAREDGYFVNEEYSSNGIFDNPPVDTKEFARNFCIGFTPPPAPGVVAPLPPPPPPTLYYPSQTGRTTIRTGEYDIDDDGNEFDQPYDRVYFNDLSIDIDAIKRQGYQYITVDILLDVREVEDGYQWIYIYDSAVAGDYLWRKKFEHTAGSRDTSWRTYSWSNTQYLHKFTHLYFDIRYAATGGGGILDDDWWKNKNLKIRLTFTP